MCKVYPEKRNSSKAYSQNNTEYNGNLKINFSDENLLDVLKNYNQADKKELGNLKEDKKLKSEILVNRRIADYDILKGKDKYTLLSFIFQFNQMLMMINNPMFFPHKAYVDMFNKDIKEE